MDRAFPVPPARLAGLLYLIVMAGGSAALFTYSPLIVRGDAATTANNILASELLFRRGFAANLIATVAYIGVAGILYEVFKPVSRSLSLVAAFLSLAGCIASAAISVLGLAPLVFLESAPYLTTFSPGELQTLSLTSLRLYGLGGDISFTFFGFYCTLIGSLAVASRFFPPLIGALMVIAGLGWLAGSFASLLVLPLADGLSTYLMGASILGEGVFTLWLLVMGVNAHRWRAQWDQTAPEIGGN